MKKDSKRRGKDRKLLPKKAEAEIATEEGDEGEATEEGVEEGVEEHDKERDGEDVEVSGWWVVGGK